LELMCGKAQHQNQRQPAGDHQRGSFPVVFSNSRPAVNTESGQSAGDGSESAGESNLTQGPHSEKLAFLKHSAE
jgi:hypothetical protein